MMLMLMLLMMMMIPRCASSMYTKWYGTMHSLTGNKSQEGSFMIMIVASWHVNKISKPRSSEQSHSELGDQRSFEHQSLLFCAFHTSFLFHPCFSFLNSSRTVARICCLSLLFLIFAPEAPDNNYGPKQCQIEIKTIFEMQIEVIFTL